MKASDLFQLPVSLRPFTSFFQPDMAPWEWLVHLDAALASLPQPHDTGQDLAPGVHLEGVVVLHPSVKLPPYCSIIGPAWIGAETEIRPGAFIRGGFIAGQRCVLGHACEFKHSILMDDVQVPHLSYVGDSVLGNGAHLGAGVVLSNLRFDQGIVPVRGIRGEVSSGLRKLGAMLGEGAEVGCNAVLQPGTVLGKKAVVVPSMAFGGHLGRGRIARVRQTVQTIPPSR